ncbi:MAG: EAL domain-containing protein [Proteobacteria bacterium]|jgi:diguanylate cyclase (GGDEF)-like protein/PAS domain S-box-containing protein|nr:EAL domain-containing protein [Pseudomonadota bacterium]
MSNNSILVVEDEVLVARDIKARLTRMGYDVVGVSGKGKDAIHKALTLRPDLILMDINLRDDIDGVEASIRIRAEYDVPVIFCTAYSNEETLQRAKISDPYGYVLKPFDNRELEINIEIALYKHRMERDLAETRQRLDVTLSNVSDGVIAADASGEIFLMNPVASKITGWCRSGSFKPNLAEVMRFEGFEPGQEPIELLNPRSFAFWKRLTGVRQQLIQRDGVRVPIELSVAILETSTSELMVMTFRDISQQLMYEEQIRRNAFYDDLTDLPNRSLFVDRLDSSLNRRKRTREDSQDRFAVLFIDLDGFGVINEGLGHDQGDRLIAEIGKRIDSTVRPDDTVSRFSGDIFAVLLDPVDGVTGSIQACNRILHAIGEPIELAETGVHISASVGIVINNGTYLTADEMIRDADTALHRAKLDAKGSYVVFDHEMYMSAKRFIDRKSSMQRALLEGAFEVHYQPIIDVETGKLNSLEALVRWPHPEEGMVSPAEFIPIAEETGLILPLGEWVLRNVCHQIKRWALQGHSGFRVAVNLSARQFENDVSRMISNIIQETEVSPDALTLEITEGIAMKNVDQNVRMLQELKRLGLSVSIDDFGTGYSSLAYLRRFPLNTLKIDRSFIRDITTDINDYEITKAIIALGQNLNLKVLAEGVETSRQVDMLRDCGCDYIQGYYYSKPVPARELSRFFNERHSRPATVALGHEYVAAG